MKFSTKSLIAATALLTTLPVFSAEKYSVDPDHTTLAFSVNHLGFSNILGRFSEFSGDIVYDKDDLANSKIDLVIKTSSITTAHAKRDAHLSSPDFFNVKEFPRMSFKSTKIEPISSNTAQVTGNLTLLGVTKPVTLDVDINSEGPNPFAPDYYVAGFSARGQIKRTDFGMKFGAPAIADTVDLILEVESIRQ